MTRAVNTQKLGQRRTIHQPSGMAEGTQRQKHHGLAVVFVPLHLAREVGTETLPLALQRRIIKVMLNERHSKLSRTTVAGHNRH